MQQEGVEEKMPYSHHKTSKLVRIDNVGAKTISNGQWLNGLNDLACHIISSNVDDMATRLVTDEMHSE